MKDHADNFYTNSSSNAELAVVELKLNLEV